MAAGSEKLSWKLYPGVEHECAHCRRPLRVVDVRRIHTRVDYSSGAGKLSSGFYCVDCKHQGYAA